MPESRTTRIPLRVPSCPSWFNSHRPGVQKIGSERFPNLPHPKLKFRKIGYCLRLQLTLSRFATGGWVGAEKARHHDKWTLRLL